MKNTSIFASAAMILATAAIATANPFSDVPASHWAYDAVNSMAEKGIVQGFPDGTFKGKQNVTRYQLAMITAKMIANVEQMGGNGSVSKTDLQTLEKLTVEFADELALLGVKVTALEDDMQVVKEDVAGLKKDVDGIKSYMKNGGMEKVKLSGDILVRNYALDIDEMKGTINNPERKAHRTETFLRLQMDAQIDENVTARARWNMIDNTNLRADGVNPAFTLNNRQWDGGNKQNGEVEVAYIQIKDMFSFGGDFKFGRDWYQHGHGFVVHNYMDAVNYTKRCGDVDVALNVFFDRTNDNDPNQGHDYYNVWNINADYSTKGHDLYLGIYYNDARFNYRINDNGALAWHGMANNKEMRVEFGASGKLSNNNEKVKYDLGLVYSSTENSGTKNVQGVGNIADDESGILGHIAVKYDDQKQLTAKLAYTFADDESHANINVENSNRFHDGDETIFEDIYLSNMALGGDTNLDFCNLSDIKLEIGYTLKDNDKHSFRLAYDHIENDSNDKGNIFSRNAGNQYDASLEANIITFEYTYKLAENTRLRLGYQNSSVEGKAAAGAQSSPDIDTNLFYTEIYSRF